MKQNLKGACSEIFGNEFSLNWQIWSIFCQNIIHGENIANMYLICKQFEKTMFMLLIVFLIFKRVFRWFLQNVTHKAFWIWLNFWYQNLHVFEKSWGIRLWIGTSTFNTKIRWYVFSIKLSLPRHDPVFTQHVT